jgi:hypothetical protein
VNWHWTRSGARSAAGSATVVHTVRAPHWAAPPVLAHQPLDGAAGYLEHLDGAFQLRILAPELTDLPNRAETAFSTAHSDPESAT